MKKIILACGLFGLNGAFVVGCGPTKCDAADSAITKKYVDCSIVQIDTGDEGPVVAECTPELGLQQECAARCTTEATCEALRGDDVEAEAAYTACVNEC
jgi:hypothetical protein